MFHCPGHCHMCRQCSICGDGDCGLVMKAGAMKILTDFSTDGSFSQDIARGDSAYLCDKLANSISNSMGGTSGALIELFFRAVALHLSSEGNCFCSDKSCVCSS